MLSQRCGITTLRERQASGKSLLCSRGIPPSRACGEKGRVEARAEAVDGITPACAGKRSRLPADRPGTEDHPRVCGEKTSETQKNQRFQKFCSAFFIQFLEHGMGHAAIIQARCVRIVSMPICAASVVSLRREHHQADALPDVSAYGFRNSGKWHFRHAALSNASAKAA